MSTNAPPLPTDLAVPILVTCLRLTRPRRLADATRVATILNTLPRTVAPDLSYTAIMLMPWIDTDVGCKLGDLWLLNTLHHRLSHAPFMRALQYTIPKALADAAAQGHVYVLDWWLENMDEIKWSFAAMLKSAGEHGTVSIVEWWLEKGDKSDWNESVVKAASDHGQLEILELSRVHGLDLHVSGRDVVAGAVSNGHVQVVLWWMQHAGTELNEQAAKAALIAACVLPDADERRRMLDLLLGHLASHFTSEVSAFACVSGDLEFMKYCLAQVVDQVADPIAYVLAGLMGHLHIMDWLHDEHNVPLKSIEKRGMHEVFSSMWTLFSQETGMQVVNRTRYNLSDRISAYFTAACAGHTHVLDWLSAHDGLHDLNMPRALELASLGGLVPVLEWIRLNDPNAVQCGHVTAIQCLQAATDTGHDGVLEWWKEMASLMGARLDARTEDIRVDLALARGHIRVLEWWQMSGLCVRFTQGEVCQPGVGMSIEGLTWWLDNGYQANIEYLINWATRNANLCVLHLLHERDLIRPALSVGFSRATSSPGFSFSCWGFHIWEFPMGWDLLCWWIDHYGPKCLEYCRDVAVDLPNALMLQHAFKMGFAGCEVDGDGASRHGAIAVLEWALHTGAPIKCHLAMVLATKYGHENILEWWRRHAERFKPNKSVARLAIQYCQGSRNQEMLKWWQESGLAEL